MKNAQATARMRRMGKRLKGVCALVALVALAFLFYSGAALAADAEDDRQASSEAAEEQLEPDVTIQRLLKFAEADEDKVTSRYGQYLMYLAASNNGLAYDDAKVIFFRRVLDRIAAIGSKESLPVLKELLNCEGLWDRYNISPESDILRALHPQASEIWYDISWKDAADDIRIKTALYGIDPLAKLRVNSEVSKKRILSIGRSVRPGFYAIIGSPGYQLDPDLWGESVTSAAVDILDSEAFRPTAEEIKRLLSNAGDFGKHVIGRYLAEKGDFRGAAALVDLISRHEDNPATVLFVCQGLFAEKIKQVTPAQNEQLIATAVKIGRKAQEGLHGEWGSIWIEAFPMINRFICQLKPTVASRKYVKDYLQFRRTFIVKQSWSESHKKTVADRLAIADEYAKKAMAKWGMSGETCYPADF